MPDHVSVEVPVVDRLPADAEPGSLVSLDGYLKVRTPDGWWLAAGPMVLPTLPA